MFSRGVNTGVAQATEDTAADHRMLWWWNYVDPKHCERRRPVVDVSAPFNLLDEAHQARRFGTQKVAMGHLSLNEFVGTYEEVPYAESHHTSEIFKLWMTVLNVYQANNVLARQISSGNASGNPRTRFAWALSFYMTMLRTNIAGLIGIGGYFYSYEYLYTHGPWPFRIRDPSPNGWKRAWEEGQECYAARAVASVFPALGYAFFMGRWKKTAFWFTFTLVCGLYYEGARRYVLSGTRLFYAFQASQEAARQAQLGSLTPDLRHRVDPDTHKNTSVAQFRYFRATSGTLQDTVWENACHENMPLYRQGRKYRNPYFNWQKAPQNYNEKPYRVKNDLWSLPQVMDAQMRSGALD